MRKRKLGADRVCWRMAIVPMSIEIMDFLRGFSLVCLLCSGIFAGATPANANENISWFATPIAEITFAIDPTTHQPRQRAFYLALVGPKKAVMDASTNQKLAISVARECAEATVKPLRDRLVNRLGLTLAQRKPEMSETARVEADLDGANKALIAVALDNPPDFYRCAAKKGAAIVGQAGFFTAIAQRDCLPSTCPVSRSSQRFANDTGDRQADWFGLLYEWLASKGAVDQRETIGFQFRLDTLTGANRSISLGSDVIVADEPSSNIWIPQLDAQNEALAFRALVEQTRIANRVRKNALLISPFAGVVAQISRDAFVKVADVFVTPMAGYSYIPVGSGEALNGISNEIARTRMLDCRYYRGASADADVATCAGVSGGTDVVLACLSGAVCDPQIPDDLKTASILLNLPRSLKDLSLANALPRYLPGQMSDLVATYNACSTDQADKGTVSRCLASSLLTSNTEIAAASGCVSLPSDQARLGCGLKSFGGDLSKAGNCVSEVTQIAAECLAASFLPPKTEAAYQCLSRGDRQVSALCLAGLAGGEAGRLASCASVDGDKLAIASCVAGDKLPPKVREGLACIAQGDLTIEHAGVCALQTELPPQYAMAVGCVTQSYGSPMSAAACVAASSLHLTANQQLALQCLASSGGQPYAFAICFGGTLTMQELTKCKGKSVGQGDCFGPHNELQKFVHALTGKDIGPDSVVGQFVTFELRPAEYVVGFVQPILADVMKIPTAAIDSIRSKIDDAKEIFKGNVVDGATKLAGDALQDTFTPWNLAKSWF